MTATGSQAPCLRRPRPRRPGPLRLQSRGCMGRGGASDPRAEQGSSPAHSAMDPAAGRGVQKAQMRLPPGGGRGAPPRCGLRRKMGEGPAGKRRGRVTEELGGGEASLVSSSPFHTGERPTVSLRPRTGGATLT